MSRQDERDGDWLSAEGDYRFLVHDLCASDPRLRRRDPKSERRHLPGLAPSSQVVVLEARPASLGVAASFGQILQCDTPQLLKAHLDARPTDDVGRVYFLEGQAPDFHAVLGDFFGIHPSFFVEHERVEVFGKPADESDKMVLPSVAMHRAHYTLKYFELFTLPLSLRNTFWLYCAETGRHIAVTRALGSYSEVGILRRKCSVWQRPTRANRGWDCVVITDPPLRLVTRDRKSTHQILPVPYRGGYLDFAPHEQQMKVRRGPTRLSLLDDLCFYLRHHHHIFSSSDPQSVPLLAKKLVAAHFDRLVDFLQYTVSYTHWNLSRQENLDIFDVDSIELQWSDIQSLERRTSEYCEDIEASMIQCRVPFQDPDTTKDVDWGDVTADFQFLYMRLRDIRSRVEKLNSAVTALTGMAGNRQALRDQELSLKEAKSTKALTFLGLVFIPLAYTASLFSMAEPYGPGYDKFWLYFAISFPLILAVIVVYYLVDLGYSWRERQATSEPKQPALLSRLQNTRRELTGGEPVLKA